MKSIFLILAVLWCIILVNHACNNPVRQVSSITFKQSKTAYSTCIAIQFSPIVINDSSRNFMRDFVTSYMSLKQFDQIANTTHYNKCDKVIDVRFNSKDYTFAQFRKLIWE